MFKEKHKPKDEITLCSYCSDLKNHGKNSFGFWCPIDKSWNAWWVFWYVGKNNNYYFRFHFPFNKLNKII